MSKKSYHKTKIIAYLELFGSATVEELVSKMCLSKGWINRILAEMEQEELIWCVMAGRKRWYELPTKLVFV